MLFKKYKNIEKIIKNSKKPLQKQKKSAENRRNQKKLLLSPAFLTTFLKDKTLLPIFITICKIIT